MGGASAGDPRGASGGGRLSGVRGDGLRGHEPLRRHGGRVGPFRPTVVGALLARRGESISCFLMGSGDVISAGQYQR